MLSFLFALIQLAFGAWLGVMGILFVFGSIPYFVRSLIINPNAKRPTTVPDPANPADSNPVTYEVSRYGFFTSLAPGQVKMIERAGGTFVRALLDYDGRMFNGERDDNNLTSDQQDYWEVVGTADNYKDSHPIPFPGHKSRWLWYMYSPFSVTWWLWKRYVYWLMGAVWVGIPGYRTLKIYPLERFKKQVGQNGKVTLRPVKDYSDHYRVAEFQFPLVVPSADTRDLVRVSAMFNIVGRVSNPYYIAYNTDDEWPTRLLASGTAGINAAIRARPLDEVISAASLGVSRTMEGEIAAEVKAAVGGIGLEIIRAEYMEIDFVDEEDARKYADRARAKVERDAAILRAEGHAAQAEKMIKAVTGNPLGETVLHTEALVRTAQALKDGNNVINLGSPATDPIQMEILRTLRRGNPTRGTP